MQGVSGVRKREWGAAAKRLLRHTPSGIEFPNSDLPTPDFRLAIFSDLPAPDSRIAPHASSPPDFRIAGSSPHSPELRFSPSDYQLLQICAKILLP